MSSRDRSGEERRVERGALFLSTERRRAWERAYEIAHEQDRSEEEARALLERAAVLATEQWLARKAA